MSVDNVAEMNRLIECVVWQDPDRMSGAPCFVGTRVPVETLFDYIEAGESINTFLDHFPGVTRAQAVNALQVGRINLIGSRRAA